jgi:hypothetical protein
MEWLDGKRDRVDLWTKVSSLGLPILAFLYC